MLRVHHDPLRARVWRITLILIAVFWYAIFKWLL